MSSVVGSVAGLVVGRFATPAGPRLHVTVAGDGETLTAAEARAVAKILEVGARGLEGHARIEGSKLLSTTWGEQRTIVEVYRGHVTTLRVGVERVPMDRCDTITLIEILVGTLRDGT